MTDASFRERLREQLIQLSSPAEVQEETLRRLGVWPSADELALEFNDLLMLLPVAVQNGEVATDEEIAIESVRDQLDVMSGLENESLWDAGQLKIAKEWEMVRLKAAQVLKALSARTENR